MSDKGGMLDSFYSCYFVIFYLLLYICFLLKNQLAAAKWNRMVYLTVRAISLIFL